MKNSLFYILSIAFISLNFGQDGINYQGAATNSEGNELVNQNISIRASIISNIADTIVQWQEIHSTTTDQFGLFNIVLGNGENTEYGMSDSFDEIDWGSGNHFLKIEMDPDGGSSYSMVGTTQMMSVPYALYAKNAGIDSTMLANMIPSFGGVSGGGCDFKFPEGIYGESITHLLTSSNYTVPEITSNYINIHNDEYKNWYLKCLNQ